jgi:hypothetical protein
MNQSSSKRSIPPASERAIKAIAPLMTVACFIGVNAFHDPQWAASCFFAIPPYLFTTVWCVFDNFDAGDGNDQPDQPDNEGT